MILDPGEGEFGIADVIGQAVAVLYKITLYRQGKKGQPVEEYEATVHSCWRQTA